MRSLTVGFGRRAGAPAYGHGLVPVVVGVVLALAVAVVAVRLGEADLDSAQRDRRTARSNVSVSTGRAMALDLDPTVPAGLVATTALSPANPIVDRAVVERVVPPAGAGAVALTALIDLEGNTVSALPAGRSISVGVLGAAWPDAVAGRPAVSDGFRYDDGVATALVLPVGAGRPWAVLVVVAQAVASTHQDFVREFGSLGDESGGLSLLDRNGTVVNSWNEVEIGTAVLTAAEVAALPVDGAVSQARIRRGVDTTEIATRLPNGYAVLFAQDTEQMYRDLRAMQRQRTLTLVAVLAGALVALVGLQLARGRANRRASSRLRALLHDSRDLVVVVDGDERVRFVSPAVEGLLGVRVDAWEGHRLGEWCHPDDTGRLGRLVSSPGGQPELNVRLRTAAGTYRWFDVEAADLRTRRSVRGILLTGHEVSRRKDLEDELALLAHQDRLTGLPNRNRFGERLDELVGGGRPARPFAVVYLDLDHFKPVNDVFGHDAGDQVLATVARRLVGAAGPGGFVCRFGGDEFGVLATDVDDGGARVLAERLLDAVRAPIAVGATLAHVDASIGVVTADVTTPVGNPEELIRRADQAMYEAKRAGRGRTALADDVSAGAGAVEPSGLLDGREMPVDTSTPDGERRSTPAALVTPGPPASPVERRTRREGRGWRRTVAPVAASGAIVVVIAALGSFQSAASLRAAESQRLEEKGVEAAHVAAYYTRAFDPQPLVGMSSGPPWALDGSPLDQAIVSGFGSSPLAGDEGTALLTTLDGRVLASSPPGARLGIPTAAEQWRRAVGGRAVTIMGVTDVDRSRNYLVLPVVRDGRTVAVLALGNSAQTGTMQRSSEIAGSVGSAAGGWSLVNADGIVVTSWNRPLVGTRLVDPSVLGPLAKGESRAATTLSGDVLVLGQLGPGGAETNFFAFTMPPQELFGDLRVGQATRDATLVAVVIAAIVGLALVNHRRDLDDRRRAERLDALLEHGHDVTVVLDDRGRATFVSSAVHGLLGHHPDDLMGTGLRDWVHPDDVSLMAGLAAGVGHQWAPSAADVRLRAADGSYRWFDLDAVDLRPHPDVAAIVVVAHEVGARKALQDELAHQAGHDPLTGLPNRAALAERLDALTDERRSEPFAVLFVDLDHFKPVNDRLGHAVGDEILRIIAGRLQRAVRADADGTDGGHRQDLVCRWGGDEFAVLLHDIDEHDVRRTADRIIGAAREPITVAGAVVRLGATIGVALSHPHRGDPEIVLREADQAMYRAKEAGRGGYALFSTMI
jgi:diguanylate cyclase (GGDEF)-like protein/PAS domain S-box-containing protein